MPSPAGYHVIHARVQYSSHLTFSTLNTMMNNLFSIYVLSKIPH